MWLFVNRNTDLFDGRAKNMLHVAPEPALQAPLVKALGAGYITADRYRDAMVKMDITNITYPDCCFDVLFCCHVLEHIADDGQAIREMYRVLKVHAWALIVVPITGDRTFEDKSITEAHDRLKVFGQVDHVRICGPDYRSRLEREGFVVTEYRAADFTTRAEQRRFGLHDSPLYYCAKNA